MAIGKSTGVGCVEFGSFASGVHRGVYAFSAQACRRALRELWSLRWDLPGPDAVQIVIEADSDLCRLGYCDDGALQLGQRTATKLASLIF
jgi:hypothetical protein